MLKEQLLFAAMDPPVRLILRVEAVVVRVPPPQVAVLESAMVNPIGRVSVKLRVEVEPTRIAVGENDLVMVGGETTVSVASVVVALGGQLLVKTAWYLLP